MHMAEMFSLINDSVTFKQLKQFTLPNWWTSCDKLMKLQIRDDFSQHCQCQSLCHYALNITLRFKQREITVFNFIYTCYLKTDTDELHRKLCAFTVDWYSHFF